MKTKSNLLEKETIKNQENPKIGNNYTITFEWKMAGALEIINVRRESIKKLIKKSKKFKKITIEKVD